ncbi:ATP-binding protein [Desulfomarina sp.]
MLLFSAASIKQKIRIILMITSGCGLAIAALSFSTHHIFSLKKDTAQKIATIARIVSKDAGYALAFDDPDAAWETLSALENQDDITTACIFDKNGELFARYLRPTLNPPSCNSAELQDGTVWGEKFLDITQPISFDNEQFGTILIRYSLKKIHRQIQLYIGTAAAIFIFSILLILFLSLFFEKTLLSPILKLKETADHITREKDYSLRAEKIHNDEIGNLVDTFNRMLEEIQNRDRKLAGQNIQLEKTVKERTLLLQLQNRKLEKSNNSLEEAVQKAKKMARKADEANRYKSLFLANMSHEIRTPMNAILGFAELLQEKIDDEQYREYLLSISSAGKNLLRLINDILDLSKIEANMLELRYGPVCLTDRFREIEQMFSKTIGDKGLQFTINYESNLPGYILLDGDRLTQILINLVGNAIKFTDKGSITLSVATSPGKNPDTVDLTIRIRDTGIGISEDQQEAVFAAFRQSAGQNGGKYGGTGLGLTISRRLVKMMNGEIFLESTGGQGTLFTVVFNNVEITSDYNSPSPSRPDVPFTFSPATVLVVDDSPINRTLLKSYLENMHLDIFEAENGREAIELTKKNSINLILLDMEMDVMNGYETARLLKNSLETSRIPIIATTASVMAFNRKKILDSGCDAILEKPIGKSSFLEVLRHYLPGRKEKTGDTISDRPVAPAGPLPVTDPRLHEQKGNIDLFILDYNKLLKERFAIIRETSIMDEIAGFAGEIESLATKYSLEFLITWSRNCKEWAENFDVNRVITSLDDFEQIISKMDTSYRKQTKDEDGRNGRLDTDR